MIKSLFLFLPFLSCTLFAQTIDTSYVDGAVYLKVNDTTTQTLDLSASYFPGMSTLFTTYGVTEVKQPFQGITVGLDHTYRIEFSQYSNVNAFISALGQLVYVNYAEPVPLFYTSAVPNDMSTNQWYLTKINAPQGWDFTTGSVNTKIAIVDNAVSTIHEDLSASIYVNLGEIPNNGLDDDFNGYVDDYKGFDAADSDGDVNPPAGTTSGSWVHGTHCSGIASASTNNGVGMAGIGYNCSIIPVKCTPNSSAGNTLNAAYEGVAYAVNAGANVISMSFGGSGSSLTGQNIISAAAVQGITLLAAAGNDNTSDLFYPAAYAQVISVGATDISDQRAGFSNYGSTIDVMAPGVSIYSTISGTTNDLYGNLSGTSMACPLTAGLCGLIISQDPTRTPNQVKAILQNGCDNIDLMNPNYIGQLGAGRINAANSLAGIFLGLSEKESQLALLSQNPFQDEITLHVVENQKYQVLNSQGQVMESFISDKTEIKLGKNYTAGIYFIHTYNNQNKKVLKVIKL